MEKEEKITCNCEEECNCEVDNCECEDCSCGHCGSHEPIIIEMEDAEGNKVNVEVVATFEDNGKNYAIVNDLDNTENSYIFEIQQSESGDVLVSIDDEKEFERLCKVVEELTE